VDAGAAGSRLHPWQNPLLPENVNNDALVSPLDVLTLINEINTNDSRRLPAVPEVGTVLPPFWDVSGDDWLTPLDVLAVIGYLNAGTSSGAGESEAVVAAPGAPPGETEAVVPESVVEIAHSADPARGVGSPEVYFSRSYGWPLVPYHVLPFRAILQPRWPAFSEAVPRAKRHETLAPETAKGRVLPAKGEFLDARPQDRVRFEQAGDAPDSAGHVTQATEKWLRGDLLAELELHAID
jgi:hypothetical protein